MTLNIDRYYDEAPEPKFELVDGQFIVGNDLRGNRHVLASIGAGWGWEAVVPFASSDAWLHALRAALAEHQPPSPAADLEDWMAWAQRVEFEPTHAPAGPRDQRLHRGICNRLRFGLFGTARESGAGQVYSRIVMRLGEDAWMPDVFFVQASSLGRLREYFLDGPADIVMEVVLPGAENRDRQFKRAKYAAGGVPEYWIVDPYQKSVEYLRLIDGEYRQQPTGADGCYRPAGVPGMAVVTNYLWRDMDELGWHVPHDDPPVFEYDSSLAVDFEGESRSDEAAPGWGSVAYGPRIGLEPSPMSFDQYISWCPEPKFEVWDGKPMIDGTRGTHNLTGFLLQSLGLIEAVQLAKPADWIAALQRREKEAAGDVDKRERWWSEVRAAATLLRERFGFKSITVIGDLVRGRPLDVWSSATLVLDQFPYGVSSHEPYSEIRKQTGDTCIHDLRELTRLNPSDREQYEKHGVAV